MQIIEIEKAHVQTGAEHSSKGNQLKWECDGWWYKADAFGFESLAEVVVSRLLAASNIEDFVQYEPVEIRYKGGSYRGCRSRNFRKESEELIPLERLVRSYTGFSLAKQLAHIADIGERIRYTVDFVRNVTGNEQFGAYLARMLAIDAFFLNEDRHTNNIALLYHTKKKTYRPAPFYDMGLSMFSDTREQYPLDKGWQQCRSDITAKPFARDFDEQLDAAEALYGDTLLFDIKKSRMEEIVWEVEGSYTEAERRRVIETLRYQAGKYQYMFS